METKQTAVEWLVENAEDFFGGLLAPSIIEQAKQMEKEQIIRAYQAGDGDAYNQEENFGEHYYNETYA